MFILLTYLKPYNCWEIISVRSKFLVIVDWLVGRIYSISTLIGYLMPNRVYRYLSNIYDLQRNCLYITIFYEPEPICLHTVKWLQVLLINSSNFFSTLVISLDTAGYKKSKWLNSSIWSIDRTLIGINTLSQSGPGSNSNEGVLYIL